MKNDYPPIGDYAFIADCHSSALISNAGSIDWCCMPRFDSPACFGRLLDWEKGGYCQIVPSVPFKTTRRYLEGTLILETTFTTDGGEARLIDCFTMRKGGAEHPHRQILRVLEGTRGKMDFQLEIVPCFEYGAVKPWIRSYRGPHFVAMGGSGGLLISGDFALGMRHRHHLDAVCSLEKGKRFLLSLMHRPPEDLDEGTVEPPTITDLGRRLEETREWWQTWSSSGQARGPYAKEAQRSAIVLKGLCNAPTGAIAAAATTSLPETAGGSRNWDYRFSWIRDSSFAVRSLAELGYAKEADGFRRFIERSAAGRPEDIQILFGLGGERRIYEFELSDLEGYGRARPVRVGNAASRQRQLDVYGELLNLAWRWHQRGQPPDEDYWEFLVHLTNAAARLWKKPDQGMWEMRGAPRHFVHSKALCWAALDRALRLAEELNRDGPVEEWKKAREEVRRAVEKKGYDRKRGVFIQAFERPEMDASLLLLPAAGFIEYQDERMVRTATAIREDLSEGGLLRRYPHGNDGLKGREGAFLCCSFWLAECLGRQERFAEAREVFERALSTGNDVGLFPEEFEPKTGKMLGNYPQALTHLSLVTAAMALEKSE